MTELVGFKYTSLKIDILKHVNKMSTIVEQLRAMETILEDPLAIKLLVVSIEVASLKPVTAAIMTLEEDKLTWEAVTERLIEECKADKCKLDRVSVAISSCHICGKSNHTTAKCFMNPMNPDNKLGLDKDFQGPNGHGARASTKPYRNKRADERRGKKEPRQDDHRAAMAKPRHRPNQKEEFMLLYSGTSAQLPLCLTECLKGKAVMYRLR